MSNNNADADGPPNLLLYMSEVGRAVFEAGNVMLASPKLVPPQEGASGVVLVVPGFTTDSKATIVLRSKLSSAGYEVHSWKQGLNLGVRRNLFDGLVAECDRLGESSTAKISVIGQSLGGIYARELAKVRPGQVCHVVTLGTPINDIDGRGSRVGGLYRFLNRRHGDSGSAPHGFEDWDISAAPPVPTTAVYSKSDGICHWRTCLQHGEHPHVENLEIPGSHLGMGVNARVLLAISERLSRAA